MMPEGTTQGGAAKVPTRQIVYVGVSERLEIAATGQVATFGEPIEVADRRRVVRHILDDHGNRYQDVVYPGVAEQLLQRPDFIEVTGKASKKEIEEAAERVRELAFADTHGQIRALELAAKGERVDEVVHGEPGYLVVEPGTVVTAGDAEGQAPTEPVTVPEQGQADVQPNPPVNLQPPSPQAQTGVDPQADVREGDADTDKQPQPGRARRRSDGTRATRRG